jgi:uncharacterized protein YrrD
MLKGAMLAGKPVLASNTARPRGYVQGMLIDYDANRLAGFWVKPGASNYQEQILPWSGVKTVEPKGVIAWSANMLASAQDLFSIRQLMLQKAIRAGMRFVTTDQQDLGGMVDFYIDESTGLLGGYEIVGGALAANVDDHSFLPAPHIITISDNEVLVPANTVKAMREKPGGLPALLNQLQAEIEAEKPTNQDLFIRHILLPRIRGLRLQRSVRSESGTITAARGQITTAALIQRAQVHQAERRIIEAVGIDLDELFRRP